ncbi:1-phosphofructokinase family hexose kinase [Knoellia locipacati]|uniref:Sugar kinase n=1 Tax=Knoellia locipacati TaxID=882824 RepID=A0A512SZI9_9MICO|nr:hexose kinase [Knoellia locipacati]GEQ13371.1 sugar kinase [Knoellia locipacati]
MIFTLTPNPALDITYAVPRLHVGESHRVSVTGTHAGGKGLNVAGVLACMSVDHVAIAPVGERQRAFFTEDAAQRGIRLRLVESPVAMRRSVAIFSTDGQDTVLNEQGDVQPVEVWREMTEIVRTSCRPGDVLAVSGSLPPSTPDDLLVDLCRAGVDAGAELVVDGRGRWVTEVLRTVPALVKPNASEATTMTGIEDPTEAARRLVADGAWAAVISRGADGLVLVTAEGRVIEARPRTPGVGSATGAGDALTAAIACGLDGTVRDEIDWPEVLRVGVAWSAAAVRQTTAGVIDRLDVDALLDEVEITERD